MKTISCAVCRNQEYREKYHEKIDPSNIDFSARRTPTKNHLRIVQCKGCDLVFSNPIFKEDRIIELYENSRFISKTQAELMAEDYLDQLKKAGPLIKEKGNLLEIGCGNGLFLKKAKGLGFKNVYGVEPGKDAVNQADPEIRGNIINDVFRDGLYEQSFFDIICVLQVFDHLIDPNEVLRDIAKVLKKGGLLLTVNHNVKFLLTKILGERSPMYDIEHIYLFNRVTMRTMLENHGFEVLYVKNILSRYTLEHAIKFFPFPTPIKNSLLNLFRTLKIADKKFKAMNGNMAALVRKVR